MDRHIGTSESTKQNLRVYISHAYEDIHKAQRLYKDLKNADLDPWLETESLLPGQNWENAVQEAIRKSQYFIPLFSSISVEKLGFIQKEFKYALGILNSIPESHVSIIPVRLDNCEIPYDNLKIYRPIDLFPSWEDGLQKILEITRTKTKELKFEPALHTSSFKLKEWDMLLESIYKKRFIPFIGHEIHTQWIPKEQDIALRWAQEFEYPLGGDELSRVSLYLAIKNNDDNYPKILLSEYFSRISMSDTILKELSNSLYGVLANLHLPIYITTNYDHLMEEALKIAGKDPVTEFCRWNEELYAFTKAAGIPSIFDKGMSYIPTASKPLVYHLYGDMEIPQSMVVTEKDYLGFLMNLYREDEKLILPSVIRKALATSLLLFTGYRLDDLNFRIMIGSLSPYTNLSAYPNIVVLPPISMPANRSLYIHEYMVEYAKKLFNIHVYWADNSNFSRELSERWQNFTINKIQEN